MVHKNGLATSDRILIQVYFDNIRTFQVGDTDGVSAEVAADLGYTPTPESFREALDNAPETAKLLTPAAHKASEFMCGDCCRVIPCSHMGVDKKGNRYSIGD